MHRNLLRIAAASIAAGFVVVPVAQAQTLPNTPENRAIEAAKKGPQELRRYIERTRSTYGLYYDDFRKYLPE